MTIAGGCSCGQVRYSLALEALPLTYACHCHQCQRWSGSAFSQSAFIPEDRITITGPVILYERAIGEHGAIQAQRVCGICHSRIYNTTTTRPGIAAVRAGTLDRSEEAECVAHIFTAYRQRWFTIPEGVAAWPEAPSADGFQALLRGERP